MTTPIPAGWKPIESAPKDGTEILAWREDCGQFIAKYTSADAFPMTQDELDAMDEETLFAKDWFTQWPDATRLDGSEAPTLWQPLPVDPCPTCNDRGAVGNILNAEPCPDCSPASVAPGDAQDEQPKRNGCGSVSFKLSDGSTVSCDWSTHEWELSIPATRHDRDIAFKELLQEIGRLRALGAAPAAGDALDADMYWNAADTEGFAGSTLDDAVRYVADDIPTSEMPVTLTFQVAKTLPNVQVLVTGVDSEGDLQYEVIDAAIAAQQGKGGEA